MINLTNFIVCIITHIIDIIVFSKLIKVKLSINLKNIILLILLSTLDFIVGNGSNSLVRLLFSNLVTFALLKLIFNRELSKTLLTTLLIYLGYVFAELLFIIIIYIIVGVDPEIIFESVLGSFLSNLVIFVLFLLIFSNKISLSFIYKIIYWYDEKFKFSSILTNIIAFVLCYILLYNLSWNNVNSISNFIVLFLIVAGIIIFITGYYSERSTNKKLSTEYSSLLKYSKIYKDELDLKGKLLHEHNTQLLFIKKNLSSSKKYKKIIDYIDEITTKNQNINERKWILELDIIKDELINSFLALKLATIESEEVNLSLLVDARLDNKKLWNKTSDNLYDFTRIMGIILDNALNSAKQSKDKEVLVEIILEKDDIRFKVSNTYPGNIDLEKINTSGYSTNGFGHGYGLAIVEDIIKNNDVFDNYKEIKGKFYIQNVMIKK